MHLGGISQKHKMKMVSEELKACLEKDEVLLEHWLEDVIWLWGRCQLLPNKPHINAVARLDGTNCNAEGE
jgi:hypothetical protein